MVTGRPSGLIGGAKRKLATVLALTTTATLALGTLISVPFAAAAEGEQVAESPVAFTVNLPEGSFAPATTEVLVHAWPSPEFDQQLVDGDKFKLHVVDAETSISGGVISVRASVDTIPSDYVSTTGAVDFEVQVIDRPAGLTRMTAMTARSVTTGLGETWIDASYTAEDLAELGTTVVSTPSVDLVETVEPSDECEGIETPTDDCEPESSLDDGDAGQLATSCVEWRGGEVELLGSRNFWARVAATYTIKEDPYNSKARMVYENSREHHTTGGIAASVSGVSYSRTGTKTVTSQWGKDFVFNNDYRSYRVEIRYGRYSMQYVRFQKLDGQCTAVAEEIGWGSRVRPRFETGGTDSVSIDRPKAYTICADQDPGLWHRTDSSGNAYENDGGVIIKDLVGINLQSRSQYATFKRLDYDIGGNGKALCGSDGFPSRAGKLMLRYQE